MILVLALGIGLTVTIATLFHAIVFRPLPVPEPDRVVKLSMVFSGDVDRRVEGHPSQFSYPELTLYREATRMLSGIAGLRHERATWLDGGQRRPLVAALVTADYFDVLRVQPALGRLIAPTDAEQPVVVISHRLWRQAFDGDPATLGRSLRIDRLDYSIIGVAERSFAGTEVDAVDVWLPLAVAAPARGDGRRLVDASLSWLQVVGRLAPGARLTAAKAEADLLATRYDAMHPGQRTRVTMSGAAALDAGLWDSGDRSKVLGVGAGAALLAAILLMICTSNAAALLLARGAARQQHVALHIALGAGRWRLVQQLICESMLMAIAAAALGLMLCTVCLRVTAHTLPVSEYFDAFVPDAAVLWFAVASAFGAALLFGVAPAIQATRVDPLPILKQGGITFGQRMPALRLRHRLVTAQVAVSLVLLVVSALLARGVERALRVDNGYSLRNLYAIDVDVPAGVSSANERGNLVRRLAYLLESAPGTTDAGLAMISPFSGNGISRVRAGSAAAPLQVQFNIVDPGYFRTLGVSTLVGRSFHPSDNRAAVIVNARLARMLWGDERAAPGQSLEFLDERRVAESDAGRQEVGTAAESAFRVATVVGVVPTIQSIDVGVPDGPTFYVPIGDEDMARTSLLVRSQSRPSLQRMLDDAIGRSDAALTVVSIEERLVSRTGAARVAATIAVLIGALALLVAAAGIYGIVAHSVIARTHEIGVHMALGAPRARVLRLVWGSCLRAIAAGSVLGSAVVAVAAIVGSPALEQIVFGVRPLDPLAFGAAIVFLAAMTLSAAYLPARRALGVGPMEALRHE
jgi:putative ABC transport system permease protein